jgi:hypothetical protein
LHLQKCAGESTFRNPARDQHRPPGGGRATTAFPAALLSSPPYRIGVVDDVRPGSTRRLDHKLVGLG